MTEDNCERIQLRWENITVSSGKQAIIQNCSGSIVTGKLVGLIGPSACGKTTLISCLTGTINPSLSAKGKIYLNAQKAEADLLRKIVCFTGHNDNMYKDATVRENTHLSALIRESKPDDLVSNVLNIVGLYQHKDKKYEVLSGGQKRRAVISTAMCFKSQVCVFDEPTTGLDVHITEVLLLEYKRMAIENNQAVLLSIHQPSEKFLRIFDEVIIMSSLGNIVFQGTLEDGARYFACLGLDHVNSNINIADHMLRTSFAKKNFDGTVSKEDHQRLLLLKNQWSCHKYPCIYNTHVGFPKTRDVSVEKGWFLNNLIYTNSFFSGIYLCFTNFPAIFLFIISFLSDAKIEAAYWPLNFCFMTFLPMGFFAAYRPLFPNQDIVIQNYSDFFNRFLKENEFENSQHNKYYDALSTNPFIFFSFFAVYRLVFMNSFNDYCFITLDNARREYFQGFYGKIGFIVSVFVSNIVHIFMSFVFDLIVIARYVRCSIGSMFLCLFAFIILVCFKFIFDMIFSFVFVGSNLLLTILYSIITYTLCSMFFIYDYKIGSVLLPTFFFPIDKFLNPLSKILYIGNIFSSHSSYYEIGIGFLRLFGIFTFFLGILLLMMVFVFDKHYGKFSFIKQNNSAEVTNSESTQLI